MNTTPLGPLHRLDPLLLETGARGIHLLFTQHEIRRAFARIDADLVREGHLLAAHEALRELAGIEDVADKIAYIDRLPVSTTDMLVFLYFRTLDQQLTEQAPTLH